MATLQKSTVTSPTYTVAILDEFVRADASTNDIVITLPAASGSGRLLYFHRADGTKNRTVTVKAAGADTLGGYVTELPLSFSRETLVLADGTAGRWDWLAGHWALWLMGL